MIAKNDIMTKKLNRKQTRTLDKILEKPRRSDIRIADVRSLILALEGIWDEAREGSRIQIEVNGIFFSSGFHKPHPGTELKTYAVKNLAEYFSNDLKEFLKEEYGYKI